MRNKDIMDVKERNEGIDLLKILACFGVVILHFIAQNSGELNRIIYYTAGFSVPMFFLIHGYFILNRKTNSAKYFMHKVSKMLVIVLCWNCAFAVLQLITGHQPINPLVVSCTELFMQKGVFYQFWFLGALILLYVVTPILQYQVEKNNVMLLAVLVMIAIIVDSASMICTYNMGKPLQEYIYQPFRIWTWILYYYMGGLIHNIKIKQPAVYMYVGGALASIILNVLYDYFVGYGIFGIIYAEYFYDNIFMIIEVVFLMVFISNLHINSNKIKQLIRCISSMTMGIYIIHLMLYRIIKAFYGFEIGVVNVLLCFVAFSVSALVTAVMKRIPLVHNLVEL